MTLGSRALTIRSALGLPLLLSLTACPSPPAANDDEADGQSESNDTTESDTGPALDYAFPEGFVWGFAVAGFQAEPGCPTLAPAQCEDPNSDWYQWVSDPELIADPSTHLSGDPLSAAPGMFELYDADFARAGDELHLGIARLSIEWSRLFPDGAAEAATSVDELAAFADPEAVAYYHDLFASARGHGLELLVTLNHYTLPLWIHDGKACHQDLASCVDRGWLDRDRILPAIALYAGFCAREFGAEVDLWATLNEPLAVVVSGYLLASASRTNPPGLNLAVDEAVDVLFNMAEGHIGMYDQIHVEDGVDADGDGVLAMVGPVMNLAPTVPADPGNPADVQGAEHADYLYNRVFLNVLANGAFDRNFDGVAEEIIPDFASKLDFTGVNYYSQITVTGTAGPVFPDYPLFDFLPDTGDLFASYPEGIAEVVAIADEYERPIYITENGSPDIAEQNAEDFLIPHLQALHGAIAAGYDVRGYMYWTLVDNYEWNHGMQLRFGLYALEDDKQRTLRPVGAALGEIAAQNGF
ncbi:MAG: glycoside hydrolase family 1 protein [Myxococcales bacterium]|nr:glycoside hydrolase family 1 protein [Myxococcales bacterium]